jgi:hypothetical protein
MNAAGHNPLRWNCLESGCFNLKLRPKIEVFADCFPGKINFGDVDALVERRGMFCLLEWKSKNEDLPSAQHISFSAFTRTSGNVVFVVQGDPKTMEVMRYCIYWDGRRRGWASASIDELKARLKDWFRYADTQNILRVVGGSG